MKLEIGSKGEDVKKLQQYLKITADGDFGPGTARAVSAWQTKNGLSADGVVGTNTWAKMFPATGSQPTSPPVQNVGPLPLNKLKDTIPDSVLNQIPATAAKFNISTPLRLAHFLAQCAHESGNFKATVEGLNYSEQGLNGTFGKYFPNGLAAKYARQPEKIASRVYANRMGNGDEASGEGYKYRGRGYIQLTGKSNYSAFSKFIGKDYVSNPDGVATEQPLASAAFFFNNNNLWATCDQGATNAAVTAVTKRVNGGTNGLDDRLKYFTKYWALLNG
jgi:putative chitinase